MSKDEERRTGAYAVTMYYMEKLLSDGIITKVQFDEIDTKMLEKYRPKFGNLFTEEHLI